MINVSTLWHFQMCWKDLVKQISLLLLPFSAVFDSALQVEGHTRSRSAKFTASATMRNLSDKMTYRKLEIPLLRHSHNLANNHFHLDWESFLSIEKHARHVGTVCPGMDFPGPFED